MINIIEDTLIDGLKLLPFLFLAFLFIELFEHKFSKKSKDFIKKGDKLSPAVGSLFGIIPQCGFSVIATNLYITRIISLGTLFSIYLATSDEMLPILIAEQAPLGLMIKVLAIKFLAGMFFGFMIDLILKRKEEPNLSICEHDHCNCKDNIFIASIKHTISIFIFILICTFLINVAMEYLGTNYLSKILLQDNIFGSLLLSLVGLIPNCAASVAITELFLNNAISFGALVGGLLTGSGVALLVLFKENKNIKENIKIVILLYLIGSISGIIIDLFRGII